MRSFTVEKSEVGVTGGRYMGKAPFNVAAKVARSLFKEASAKYAKKGEIRFTIRETTEGSSKKMYSYIGMRKSLSTPIQIRRGDKDITIKHTYHIKSCSY